MTAGAKQLDVGTASTLVLPRVNPERTVLRAQHCETDATSRGGCDYVSLPPKNRAAPRQPAREASIREYRQGIGVVQRPHLRRRSGTEPPRCPLV